MLISFKALEDSLSGIETLTKSAPALITEFICGSSLKYSDFTLSKLNPGSTISYFKIYETIISEQKALKIKAEHNPTPNHIYIEATSDGNILDRDEKQEKEILSKMDFIKP